MSKFEEKVVSIEFSDDFIVSKLTEATIGHRQNIWKHRKLEVILILNPVIVAMKMVFKMFIQTPLDVHWSPGGDQ